MTPFEFSTKEAPAYGQRNIGMPAAIESKRELFDLLAGVIPLPAYFGHNWDALEECLLDLGWLSDTKLGLIHQDIPLAGLPAEQRIYLKILSRAAKEQKRLRISFPADFQAQVESILAPH